MTEQLAFPKPWARPILRSGPRGPERGRPVRVTRASRPQPVPPVALQAASPISRKPERGDWVGGLSPTDSES